MGARTPEELDRLFSAHMAAGDVDAVVALYEPNGVLVSPDGDATTGDATTGAAAIRAALAGLAAMRPRMTMNVTRAVHAGDALAVVYNDWTMSAVDSEGKTVTMLGRAIEVSRRQPDRTWLYAVDDPFGQG